MTLAYSRICSPGGRQYNQDSTSGRAEGGKACFVVCDGLGAYKNWAVIASWAVFTVIAAPITTGMLGNVEIRLVQRKRLDQIRVAAKNFPKICPFFCCTCEATQHYSTITL